MIKKRVITVLLVVMQLFTMMSLLTGCETAADLGKSAIAKYVKEEIGLTDFDVSSKFEKVKPENSLLTSRLWTVTDNKYDVEFHVLDLHAGSGGGGGSISFDTANYLSNDYVQKLISQYADELPVLSQIDYEFTDEHRAEQGKTFDYYAAFRKYGYETGGLKGSYRTRSELSELFEQIDILEGSLNDLFDTIPKDISVYARYMYEDRDGVTDNCLADVAIPVFGSKDEKQSYFESIEPHFLEMVLWFRCDEEALNEYSHEEIARFVSETDYVTPIGVYHNGNDRPDVFDDITTIRTNNRAPVSFGSLYEILKRENYPVDGTPRQYTFKGIDGAEYEVSYNFKDAPEYYDYGYRWYYNKNGEKEYIMYEHTYAFSFGQVLDMTGIKLSYGEETARSQDDTDTNDVTDNINSTFDTSDTERAESTSLDSEKQYNSSFTISMPDFDFPDVSVPVVSMPDFDLTSSKGIS